VTTERRRRVRTPRTSGGVVARRIAIVLGFVALLGLGAGCRSVEPWEREQLAAPRMQREPHAPHAAFLDHVRQSREAATTGDGSGGGGCGCY
jgi:hypothetical protein